MQNILYFLFNFVQNFLQVYPMATQILIEEFLEKAKHYQVIDVRSPGEYEHGHIPGAINIPLFDNDERAVVGTIYKKNGKNLSIIKGLEFVGPKLAEFAKLALKFKNENTLIYCWRGGMRSASMAWLFETVELKTFVLTGGYKSYRTFLLNSFNKPLKLIVLGGYTGAGKTDILKALEQHGEQIIDLEGLAQHKGSAFGALGQKPQPTVEMFENMLFDKINQLDKSLPVWIEDEGKNIGCVNICNTIWNQLSNAPIVIADTNYNIRLNRLLKNYACFPKEDLKTAIKKIEKRLGYDNCQKALKECDVENFEKVAEICLTYYDKAYNLQLTERLGKTINQTPKVTTNIINGITISNLKNIANRLYK